MASETLWNIVKTYTDSRHILCRPLSLSACRICLPRLLERHGLPTDGNGSVFMMAVPYLMAETAFDTSRNVSLYAVPRDYHLFFKELSNEILPLVQKHFPQHHAAVFADHSPIDEVNAAACAGLGDVGLNGLLLTPEYGNFVFIGALISDVPFDTATRGYHAAPSPSVCTRCGRCLQACPIHCRADREGCLSALTQKKGELSSEDRQRLSDHALVWGCDICQMVCPINERIIARGTDTPVPFFREQRTTHLTADDILKMSDEAFAERAYAWRKRDTILRNLSIKQQTKGGSPL